MIYIEIKEHACDIPTWLYENMKMERELFFMDHLDINDLIDMALNRPDKKVMEKQLYSTLHDYITEHLGELVNEYEEGLDAIELVQNVCDDGYLDSPTHFENISNKLNLKFGTVGYSPWSYYLAVSDIDLNYIRDLYEGWNFYDLIVYDANDRDELVYNYTDTFHYDNENIVELCAELLGTFDYSLINSVIEMSVDEVEVEHILRLKK